MARFEIKTKVPNWTGVSAGVSFASGRAVITSDTQAGLAALAYFHSAGYGIAELDGVSVNEVLTRANESPDVEFRRLTAEIATKENRLQLETLRERNRALDAQVFKVADTTDLAVLTPSEVSAQGGAPQTTQVELKAPPADNAPVVAWRNWAVKSGRATEDQVKVMSKEDIATKYGAEYDAERDAQLKLAASQEGQVS